MIQDLIVEDVRAIREQLAAQFNFDIRKIVEDAQMRQAKSQSKIVSYQRIKQAPHAVNPAFGSIEITQANQTSEF